MIFIEVLKYGFLFIFFATALIGIASIPDWIKIPEWYRKRIFVALILEVIGVIIILFNQELITTGPRGIPQIKINDNNWIALDENGLIVNPEIQIETEDTLIIKKLGEEYQQGFKKLSIASNEDGLNIQNQEKLSLGSISKDDLKKNGLFNSFKTAKGEITSTENYAYVKWEKSNENNWKKKGSFIEPFELEVYDNSEGTYYRIKNIRTDEEVFNSGEKSKNLISVDNRIVHFLEDDGVYYLLRISWADLHEDNNYVHVINIRMEPIIR